MQDINCYALINLMSMPLILQNRIQDVKYIYFMLQTNSTICLFIYNYMHIKKRNFDEIMTNFI